MWCMEITRKGRTEERNHWAWARRSGQGHPGGGGSCQAASLGRTKTSSVQPAEPNKPTFVACAKEWYGDNQNRWSPETVTRYEAILRLHIEPTRHLPAADRPGKPQPGQTAPAGAFEAALPCPGRGGSRGCQQHLRGGNRYRSHPGQPGPEASEEDPAQGAPAQREGRCPHDHRGKGSAHGRGPIHLPSLHAACPDGHGLHGV